MNEIEMSSKELKIMAIKELIQLERGVHEFSEKFNRDNKQF